MSNWKPATAFLIAMVFISAVSIYSPAQYTTINNVGKQSLQIGGGAAFPASCKLRDLWVKSGTSAGLYVCTVAGPPVTWTMQSGGSVLSYSTPFTSTTTASALATTHGQGTKPKAFCIDK